MGRCGRCGEGPWRTTLTSSPASTPSPTTTFFLVIQWPTISTLVEISGSTSRDGLVSFDNIWTQARPRGSSLERKTLDSERASGVLLLLCSVLTSLVRPRSIAGVTAWPLSPTEGSEQVIRHLRSIVASATSPTSED